eukprot:Platyproteum_vivax@DN5711_c0_g1_i1.p1
MAANGMPPNILIYFASRPPLEFVKPLERRKMPAIACLGSDMMANFESDKPPLREPFEPPKDRRARLRQEKIEQHRESLKKLIEQYNPLKDPNAVGDPFRTLFVARLSYDTTEKRLKREFEQFGPIKRVKIVMDEAGKSRGYAFIEYESDRDLKAAYKQGDGRKIDGRRVLVDVERGRTVEGWLPRRLGVGRGPPRGVGSRSKADKDAPAAGGDARRANYPPARDRDRGDANRERHRDRSRERDRSTRDRRDEGQRRRY